MTTATVQETAREALGYFEIAERPDGSSFVRLKDERPAWVYEVVYVAHGNMLPDDWKYKMIRDSLDVLSEVSASDEADEQLQHLVPVYSSDLLAWLGSNLQRVGYCDSALDEYGSPSGGITAIIAAGYYEELTEVFGSVQVSIEAVTQED